MSIEKLFTMLSDVNWESSYRSEDGNLAELFYIPALSFSMYYDRVAGYFTPEVLKVISKGIRQFIQNDGKMRLIVGCTLSEAEMQAIDKGYEIRRILETKFESVMLVPEDFEEKEALECLAWLICNERLDVKISIKQSKDGKLLPDTIFHHKIGILKDFNNNTLMFSGSINETKSAWTVNSESFHVFCSWKNEDHHILKEKKYFERLWNDQSPEVRTFSFPHAYKLLKPFYKPDKFDRKDFHTKERIESDQTLFYANTEDNHVDIQEHGQIQEVENIPKYTVDEKRKIIWSFVHYAPMLENGIRIGEITSTIKPWPHQYHSFKKMMESSDSRFLISDEVGLGKTITAGLFIRQMWISKKAKRILILVPKSVLKQWQNELYEKFNLHIPIYDGSKLIYRETTFHKNSLEQFIEKNDWHKIPFILVSSHLMRRSDRQKDFDNAIDWDLIVLDEAHHARRKAAGSAKEKGPNTLLHLMQNIKYKTKSLLLLTATPMQVHPIEVFDLLELLGLPVEWKNSKEFLRYFEVLDNPVEDDYSFLQKKFHATEKEYGKLESSFFEKHFPDISIQKREKVLNALREKSTIPLKRLSLEEKNIAFSILKAFTPIRNRMIRNTRDL